MTVTVRLIEASAGQVSKLSTLCTVSGKIPVYADDGKATRAYGREIPGCKMPWKGKNLDVSVRGALAISHGPLTFAMASVAVTPPDARPLCPDVCGPQALADSRGEITIGGRPRSLKFSLGPNPVSIMNARPTVWLEADIAVAD